MLAVVKEIGPEEFRGEIEKSPLPALVEFYAGWCPKCAMMEDVVAQFAAENAGAVRVYRVDADQSKELMESYGLDRVPTFLSFREGKVTGAVAGVVRKKVLEGLF